VGVFNSRPAALTRMLSYRMPIAADTSPEADAAQVEAYRRMGARVEPRSCSACGAMTRQAAEAGIRTATPSMTTRR